MDQVRAALGWLKRQHFWVLSVVVVLIALGCWMNGKNKLSAAFNANKQAIEGGWGQLKGVQSASFHPNQTIIDRQTAENKTQADSVKALWQQLYDRQRAHVLTWPEQLSKSFRDAVEKMKFNDEIPVELRNNYQNYIERHFPELPKQIGARPVDPNATGGAGAPGGYTRTMEGNPGMAGVPEDDDYICQWMENDQIVIRDELNFPQRPSSLRIWITQEDLWVYHTLLDVIAKTNQAAGASRKANAAVKTVYSIEVGPRAAQYSRSPGRLMVPPQVAAAVPGAEGGPPGAGPGPEGAPAGVPGGRPMMLSPEGRGGGLGGNMPMSPAQEQAALLSGRYLDEKGQPIPFGSVGATEGGGPAQEAPAAVDPNAPAAPVDFDQFGKAYKRLPVRLVMEMDLRWLQALVANCANEPLRVEVQEVRVNVPDAMAAGMPGGGGGYTGRGGMGGPGGNASPFPDRTGLQTFLARPNVATVVVQGTIFIFNKPNLNILGAPAEQPVAATTP